jgi:transcriptional regulator with XRE-family HTH domain
MKNLRDILAMRDHNQAWLARELGVSDAALSRWAHGYRHPSRATLRRIASLLGCEVQELTGEIELMTGAERRWLEAFRNLPEDKKGAALQFLEALAAPETAKTPSESENEIYRPGKNKS